MSVKIPDHFDFGFDVDLDLDGIPSDFSIDIKHIPKIDIGIDPMEFKIAPLEIKPIDLSFRIKEVPSVRVHLPVDYKVAVALFGIELACVRLCGQSQVITEPYVPNPCECKGSKITVVRPVDTPDPVVRPVG